MDYINKVQLAGRVGYIRKRDINGKEVASFSVCVEESFRKRTGEAATVTTFINCEAWSGQNVDTSALAQGCEVDVLGRIATRKYTDRDGNERTATEVKVFSLRILGYPAPPAVPEAHPVTQTAPAPAPAADPTFPDIEDLPF